MELHWLEIFQFDDAWDVTYVIHTIRDSEGWHH